MPERNSAVQYGADRDIVLKALKQNEYALSYAAPELEADREFMPEAAKQSGCALKNTAPEQRRTVRSCSKP